MTLFRLGCVNYFLFSFKKDLGSGAFGIVKLVKNKETNTLYAMKQMLKDKLPKKVIRIILF